VQVLGLNAGPDPLADLLIFVDAFQMTYPVLLDGDNNHVVYRQSGATSPFPLDYVIDQAGNVAYHATEYDPAAMIEVIDRLLANSPELALPVADLDFGEVVLGRADELLLEVRNDGDGTLQIHSISTTGPDFTANLTELLVPPGASRFVVVNFTPTALGERFDTLVLHSNDPTTPARLVPLQGTGLDPVSVGDMPQLESRLGNEPNPFNPFTNIRFSLVANRTVWLTIYDTQGRVVRRLLSGVAYPAGEFVQSWNGQDDRGRSLPSGVYLVRLRAGSELLDHKMSLLR